MITTERKLSNISLILFDWSGVISDDRPPVYEANMRLLQKYGVTPISFEEWLPRTRLSAVEFLADHGISGDENILAEEYRLIYTKVRSEGIHPRVYADARSSVSRLISMGKRLKVISSHPEQNLRQEAKEYGLEGSFEGFLGDQRDKTLAINATIEEMKMLAETVLYVGDTIYDIQAAKKAGVHSAGIASGYHVKERLIKENPDLLVDSLTELVFQL